MNLRLQALSAFASFVVAALRPFDVSAFGPVHPVKRSFSGSSSRQMFTGIIEEMGTVVSLEEREDMMLWDGSKGKGTELVVRGNVVMEGAYLG